MTTFFQHIFSKYPVKTRRALELLPGIFSWTLILFPVWGALFIPYTMAYFILFFDVYWLYKSISLAISASIASKKIRASEKVNWLEVAKKEKDFRKVTHFVVIPNYQERLEKIQTCLRSLAAQSFPKKRIYVVLAMEEREEGASQKAEKLVKEFGGIFGGILPTYHPDVPGEVKGKSSNQAWGGIKAYEKYVESGDVDINYATISSTDADSIFDKHYFSNLSYQFLKDPKRYQKFWQSANVHYNNFWTIPAPIRVMSFFGNLWRTALLVMGDRLVINSTYSLSFVMLRNIGFWDTDVIPEDYRIFFKAYYKLEGQVWVEPIYLKTLMDAPLSSTYVKSIKNKYQQERRWSWGVSDDPLYIKWWFTVPNVPFIRKSLMLFTVLLDHFLWPVNWFIITIAANIIPFVNPVFSRTTIGYNLPRLAGLILTLCLFGTFAMIIIDFRNRPKNFEVSRARQFLFPLEFVLLPLVGFFLNALPALISNTQL